MIVGEGKGRVLALVRVKEGLERRQRRQVDGVVFDLEMLERIGPVAPGRAPAVGPALDNRLPLDRLLGRPVRLGDGIEICGHDCV